MAKILPFPTKQKPISRVSIISLRIGKDTERQRRMILEQLLNIGSQQKVCDEAEL